MGRDGAPSTLPVICVGNFVAGGAGKTPFAIEIARRLSAMGERPVFLTRGYGGSLEGPILVAATHMASEVGDEALLLAGQAPTIVARSRIAGASLAETTDATVIVMDDGFQNPSLAKDFSFVVIDAAVGIGNGLCLPAGPLRAPLRAQWRVAKALVVMRAVGPSSHRSDEPEAAAGRAGQERGRSSLDDAALSGSALAVMAEAERRGLPVYSAVLRPEAADADALRGRKIVAFAGIGRPSKFFATLKSIGADLILERSFPDHYDFRASDLASLAEKARAAGALLVTTEKDMARLRGLGRDLGRDAALSGVQLHMLRVKAKMGDPESLDSLLRGVVRETRCASPRGGPGG
jgi:tetraacyldisaccharide 4'-kinase